MGLDPLDEALAELDRGRRNRATAVVAGGAVGLAAGALAVAVATAVGAGSATFVAALAVVVVATVHLAVAVAELRRAARMRRALTVAGAVRRSGEARERTLGALHAAVRRVTGSLELADVVDRAVAAVTTLVGASDGVVLLRTGQQLAVAAAVGPDAAPRGTRRPVTPADRAVLEGGETVVGGRGGGWGDGPGTITAPLALPERIVGTLVVRRGVDARPFDEDDRLAVALLAELVAVALRNATAHDRERQRAEAFRSLIGVPPDDPDGPIATRRG